MSIRHAHFFHSPLYFLFITLISFAGCEDENTLDSNSMVETTQDSELTPAEGKTDMSEDCAEESSDSDQEDSQETPEADPIQLDLRNDDDNLWAWRKTRASLDPNQDVVFYWVGYVYHLKAKDPQQYGPNSRNITFESPLFRFEGFNVARFAEVGPNQYEMLSREVSVYQNPQTEEIVDCWRNPLLVGQPRVRVAHVANDPVNFGVGPVSYVNLGQRVSFFSDVFLAYRSPLAADEAYADYSASDVYQSSEMFNFYVDLADLEDPNSQSAPVEISWTRVGQYLPWMQMGDLEGQLVYHVRGYKVLDGVEGLPPRLLEWTESVAGEKYLSAPETVPLSYSPNATTWRVFKEELDSGNYTPQCD